MDLKGGYRDRRLLANYLRHGDFRPRVGYLAAVRHPWPCLVFVVLVLAAYEAGVHLLAPASGQSIRAGLDLWLREWLTQFEPCPPIIIPATLVFILVAWSLWKRNERPDRLAIPVIGIALEGIVFGFILWAVCVNAPFLLEQSGISFAAINGLDPQTVTFLGVGLYEETLFRLIGFVWLARLLNVIFIPWLAAIPIAGIVSAAAFALAHHLVQSDPFIPTVFATRMLIGVYCAMLCWLRGFGVAVGAHVVYDILAGILANR
jgi:hypothetical protein